MRRLWFWLVAGVAIAVACVSSDATAPADPMLLVEAVVLILIAVWVARLSATGVAGMALARELDRDSEATTSFDVPFRRLRLRGRGAFALGLIAPRIYVSEDLESALNEDELRAILLHEEHHRVTRAPLRGAALLAWLAILGRIGPVRERLVRRLADLECLADAHALVRGVPPSALASALVKTAGSVPVGLPARLFAGASEPRVVALLDAAAGRGLHRRTAPLEWLPLAATSLLLVGCHLVGVALLG